MASQDIIADLNTRIAYLEENRRYIQNALEMVLSLEDFYTEIGGGNCSLQTLLPEAKRRIDAIIPFEVLAFYMVDEADFSFQPTYRHPDHLEAEIQEEVDYMIDEGYFAWAIRERRGVVISSKDHSRQYLLHVIANHNQVKGMFGGLLPSGQTKLPDTAMTLLSIILLHVANASESMAYTDLLKNQSRILEAQVAERTRELTRSQKELQAAMDQTRAMAEAARAASRAKGDFLANMSHELRTPLNGIIGMTEVALSTGLDANQRRIVEIISRESFSLLRQINDVLDFSKIESGKMDLEQVEFDLDVLMEEIGENFALQTSEKGVELNVFIAPDTPTRLEGDPHRLRQVLFNLTGNAVKFTHEGEIFIEARPENSSDGHARIRFSIKDTGIGISEEKIDQVFSSFTQADNSTTRQYGGTGLGTTISKQLVELMGGQIGVDSRVGEGSTFWFTAAFATQKVGPKAVVEIKPGARPTILLAVKNATLSRILSTYLDHLGATALAESDNPAALSGPNEWAGTGRPPISAIITDDPPSGSGAKHRGSDTRQHPCPHASPPIIIITSLRDVVSGGGGPVPGRSDDATLEKPVKFKDLQAVVAQVTGLRFAECTRVAAAGTGDEDGRQAGFSGHILVADDYLVNRQVAYMHLTAAGFTVDLVDDGRQAFDAFSRTAYDMIFMDIQMPVLNGLDATKRIREIEAKRRDGSHIPIIALTANAMKGVEQDCLDAGMDGYLVKPVNRRQLITAARQSIDPHGPQHRLTQASPEKTPVDADTDIMDIATALDEFGDADSVKMLAGKLVDSVADQLQTIRKAMAAEDRDSIRKESHAIKGGAATLEASPLSRAAACLENISPNAEPDELNTVCAELEHQFFLFREFVSQWKGI